MLPKLFKLVLGVCVIGFALILLWAIASKVFEAKQNVESASFDVGMEQLLAHFSDTEKEKDEHLANAEQAKKAVVQATGEYNDAKKAMDGIPDMLKDVVNDSAADLDKKTKQAEAK
jgi:hypothetical protein